MCELALLEGGGGSRGDLDGGVSEMAPSTATPCDWLMVDRWESMQTEFQSKSKLGGNAAASASHYSHATYIVPSLMLQEPPLYWITSTKC